MIHLKLEIVIGFDKCVINSSFGLRKCIIVFQFLNVEKNIIQGAFLQYIAF